MNKKELREIIREEVQKEIYEILPQLLKETMTDLLAKQPKGRRRKAKQKVVKESKERTFDRTKLTSLLGYGDMKASVKTAKTPPTMVAGVPIVGGLAEKEEMAGMSALRDYDDVPPQEQHTSTEEFSSVPELSAGEVPTSIVAALGGNAKKVLEETNRMANWRPGMKRG